MNGRTLYDIETGKALRVPESLYVVNVEYLQFLGQAEQETRVKSFSGSHPCQIGTHIPLFLLWILRSR